MVIALSSTHSINNLRMMIVRSAKSKKGDHWEWEETEEILNALRILHKDDKDKLKELKRTN